MKEKVGLYEIESINNTCMIVIAVSRKEYFNQFKNQDFNKKHKGVKRKKIKKKCYWTEALQLYKQDLLVKWSQGIIGSGCGKINQKQLDGYDYDKCDKI